MSLNYRKRAVWINCFNLSDSKRNRSCTSKRLFADGATVTITVIEIKDNISKSDLSAIERYWLINEREISGNNLVNELMINSTETLKDRRREWKNTKVECVCSGRYIKACKARHIKTKLHQNYIRSLAPTIINNINNNNITVNGDSATVNNTPQ